MTALAPARVSSASTSGAPSRFSQTIAQARVPGSSHVLHVHAVDVGPREDRRPELAGEAVLADDQNPQHRAKSSPFRARPAKARGYNEGPDAAMKSRPP
jgi:hypothetical protein